MGMIPGFLRLVQLFVPAEYTAFIGYITNNAFPQPLSEDDEADCLSRMQLGDQDAKNTIIEHNLRLVAHICKKFEGTGEDNDDLISIGTIGLIKAINTFDPAKGTKLATYAARCIENEVSLTIPCRKYWKIAPHPPHSVPGSWPPP